MVFGALGLIYTKQENMNGKLSTVSESFAALAQDVANIDKTLNQWEVTK